MIVLGLAALAVVCWVLDEWLTVTPVDWTSPDMSRWKDAARIGLS